MFKVQFADIGEGLTEGKVIDILVNVGDEVKAGDSLFSVETDKVNADIPSPVTGKIKAILIKPDQEINVGDVVIEIDDGLTTEPDLPEVSVVEEENASVVGSTPVSNDVIPSRGQTAPTSSNSTSNKNSQNQPVQDENYEFDVIIVGAGIGGYVAAIKAAQFGLKTLIIEKEYYGGVCLNVGCIPTKALLKTAKNYEDILNKSAKLGIDLVSKPTINWPQALTRKDDVVKKLTKGVQGLLTKNHVEQVFGVAKAVDAHHIEVAGKTYTTKNLVVATGSKPNELPLPGFDDGRKNAVVINSTGILSLPTIPKSLIVIGGGVIGVEFACLFASLGTKVTIIQALPTILEMLDKDVIALMTKELTKKYHIDIITNAKVLELQGNELFYEVAGQRQGLKADFILEAVGRKPVINGFENLDFVLTDRKTIKVDDYLETSIDGVYAIGDVIGRSMLAHVASHSGIVAVNHIAKNANLPDAEDLKMNFDQVPSCVYTNPEVAMVGKTEQQLEAENIPYETYKFPFSAIGKALIDDDTTGFVKIIMDPEYKAVLGAHIVGNRATDMISEFTVLLESEGTVVELANAIHPHPTMSEAIGEAAEALLTGKAINI